MMSKKGNLKNSAKVLIMMMVMTGCLSISGEIYAKQTQTTQGNHNSSESSTSSGNRTTQINQHLH